MPVLIYLFLNRFGRGMGPNAVWHVVHKYARIANIDRAVSTHTFRHYISRPTIASPIAKPFTLRQTQ
jgi:site-specific recombinase XerD